MAQKAIGIRTSQNCFPRSSLDPQRAAGGDMLWRQRMERRLAFSQPN